MQRVKGIGGVFVKAGDPQGLRDWYARHLGVPVDEWGGGVFRWREHENPEKEQGTIWSVFEKETTYLEPSTKPFMINFIVEDLDAMIIQLRDADCEVISDIEVSEFGKFGWVIDPEGHKIELWQPPS